MLIPYTREAISQLRTAARNSTPRDAVIAQFGWSPGMLERVCRDHGIAIAPPVIANSITPADVAQLPLPAEQLAEFMDGLPPRQLHVIKALRAASLACDDYIPASAILASEGASRNVKRVIGAITAKMSDAKLPYRIEFRTNHGYRLLFTGAKS